MVKFLDRLGLPVAASLPVSGVPGEVIYYAGTFYGWTGSAWSTLSDASIAAATILGNPTGSSAASTAMTGTQATALLDTFSTTLKGLVPAPATATGKFLKDDGTWAAIGTEAWTVLETSTGASQSITIPESGVLSEEVVVTIAGLVQDPVFYTITGTSLTITAPDVGQSIVVRKLAGAGGGSGGNLDSLSDVDTTTVAPQAGQTLVWDSAASLWKPGTSSVATKYRIGFSVEEITPSPTEVLMRHVFDSSVTFADDFVGSVARLGGANPASEQVLSVKHNAVEIGFITVPIAGSVSFSTTGGSLVVAIGDELRIEAPISSPAPELVGMSVTILGEEN